MRTVHLHTLSNAELVRFTKSKKVASTLELELSTRLEDLIENKTESDEDCQVYEEVKETPPPRLVDQMVVPEGVPYLITEDHPLVCEFFAQPERGSYERLFDRWLNPDYAPQGFLEALDNMLSQTHVVLISSDTYYLKNCCATIKKYLEHTK